jgi:hypothetical protein
VNSTLASRRKQMLLYHATKEDLTAAIGKTLPARARDLAIFDHDRRKLEELLEQRHPSKQAIHRRCWFACDSPGLAAIYMEGQVFSEVQPLKGPLRLYAVRMNAFTRQPM